MEPRPASTGPRLDHGHSLPGGVFLEPARSGRRGNTRFFRRRRVAWPGKMGKDCRWRWSIPPYLRPHQHGFRNPWHPAPTLSFLP
jgi:hypothetical protein